MVWPQPYTERAPSRPGVRELTRVESNPCPASQALIAVPVPTSFCSQSEAVLSLVVIMSIATCASGTGVLSRSLPRRSSSPA